MELLNRCRDHAHKFYGDLLRAAAKSLNDELFSFAEKSTSNEDQRRYYEAIQHLKGRSDAMQVVFAEGLKQAFDDFMAGRDQERSLEAEIDAGQLSLVKRDDLEDDLAISVIVSKSNSRCAELLWKLNRRLAVTRGGQPVSDETNPFGPQKVCDAMQRAVHELGVDAQVRITIYKHLGKMLLVSFAKELQALDNMLSEKGVLPNLRFSVAKSDSANKTPLPDNAPVIPPPVGEDAAGFRNQQQLYDAIRALQASQGPRTQTAGGVSFGNIATDGSGGADTFSAMDYALALSALQQSAEVINAVVSGRPLSVEAVESKVIEQLTRRAQPDARHKMTRNDADTVDLVGMIFRYVLDDPNLHDSVKSLLSLLHTPYLKLALIDQSFLEHYDHSARLLINRMADVGSRWVKDADDRTVLPKLKTVVDTVLKGFIDDVTIFDRLLEDFNRFRDNLEKRAQMVEKRNTEAQQGLERLELAKQTAFAEFDIRLKGKNILPAAVELLRQPWADFLSYNLLRHGDESLSWKSALKVVDGVVWSVRSDAISKDSEKFREQQQELDKTVEEGLQTIGYDAQATQQLLTATRSAQQQVFDSLTGREPAASTAAASAPKAAAPTAVPPKAESAQADSAQADSAQTDSADASMPSADGAPVGETLTAIEKQKKLASLDPAEQEMAAKLKAIDFGTWFLFSSPDQSGPPQRLKLAWYSRVTSHYMFVDSTGVKQRVENQLDLARAMAAGAVAVVAPNKKSFMERALEAVVGRLKRAPSAK